MTIVEVMAVVSAGTVLIAWKVYKLYQRIDDLEDELMQFEEGMGDKINELIEQCNANTLSIARMHKHKSRTKKNDGLEAQG